MAIGQLDEEPILRPDDLTYIVSPPLVLPRPAEVVLAIAATAGLIGLVAGPGARGWATGVGALPLVLRPARGPGCSWAAAAAW